MTVAGRWARLLASLREAAADEAEIRDRMWLLNNPWEEDYLHWVGEGDERRLHGRIPPPQDGRQHSTTREGWCRGLVTEAWRARRNGASPPP